MKRRTLPLSMIRQICNQKMSSNDTRLFDHLRLLEVPVPCHGLLPGPVE